MASADQELAGFVREALSRGKTRAETAQALRDAGWAEDLIDNALAGFADIDFPVPVPRPRPSVSAREAFLYLVLFSALGLSAWHLGSLCFQLIDLAFADPAETNWAPNYAERKIRWAVAFLVVAFPLYLFVTARLARETAADPSKLDSGVRKWLTYLTLFVATLFILGDLVALIHQFLSGELTIRVLLKIVTVAVISGAIFGWYLRSVSRDGTKA